MLGSWKDKTALLEPSLRLAAVLSPLLQGGHIPDGTAPSAWALVAQSHNCQSESLRYGVAITRTRWQKTTLNPRCLL